MTQERWEAVWKRSRAGRHTVVIRSDTVPPAPPDLQVLRIRCDAPGSSGGALDAAHRQVVQLLGQEGPPGPAPTQSRQLSAGEPGRAPFAPGLRQRFLGDIPGPSFDALLVEACNRLADRTEGRAVLAFEAIDAADEATVDTLAHILQCPGWLRLPLLLTMRGTPQGRVAELVYLLCHDEGEAAMLEIEGEKTPDAAAALDDWTQLPADVLRVLRAGAVLGTTFEAPLVARLLEEPLGVVLQHLQAAADAGVPLADRGQGQFTVPPAISAALQSSTLPSLLTFWHARLGELLSSGRAADDVGLPSAAPRTVARGRQAAPAEATFDLPPGDATAAPTPSRQQNSGAHQRAEKRVPPSGLPGDPTRAASHLEAAGRTEAALEHYLTAVREAAARGDTRRAYGLTEQALALLNALPTSPQQALLRTQLWLERGRLQWHGALQGTAFTLQEALTSLEAARSSLPPDAPSEVVEQLAAVTAGVYYDVGDQEALQRALAELQESSQRLAHAGEILLAAHLLNDQAAVYMRLGDAVRATYLLAQSHERFASHLRQHPQDSMAIEALADTEHLLARLPLHVQTHPGREEGGALSCAPSTVADAGNGAPLNWRPSAHAVAGNEAYARGLEHARAAENLYQRLGQYTKLARLWDTMGRLALQQGHLEAAQERLTAALNLQRQLGDVPGLARSSAALADLCIMAGQLGDAVALLADSITLNFAKGSPIGLALNRQALGALASAAAQTHDPGAERLRSALVDLEGRLAQAESVLGRVGLPAGEGAGVASAAPGSATVPARRPEQARALR